MLNTVYMSNVLSSVCSVKRRSM